MARKKTRKQKKKTQVKRQITGEVHSTSSTKLVLNDELLSSEVSNKTSKKRKISDISFGYDPKLIISDLRKTLILSALIFAIEIGLFLVKQQGMLDQLFR